MFDLNSLILFSEKPGDLVDFYKKVLQAEPKWSGGDFTGFRVGSGSLIIGPHDKIHGKNKNPERIIFNLETPDVEKEYQRLKDVGAASVQEPYQPQENPKMTLATLADPDGNYFQLASQMEM